MVKNDKYNFFILLLINQLQQSQVVAPAVTPVVTPVVTPAPAETTPVEQPTE